MLWIRPLDSLEAQSLAGTEGAEYPFWSPDSRFLGFFADGKLKKVGVSGGSVQTLADAPGAFGGAWNHDGVIVFAPQNYGGLVRVSAAGGVGSPVTTLDSSRGEIFHRWPQFLPDGRHFLYLVRSDQPENNGIYLGSLDSEETRQLLRTDVRAAYASGCLLFLRERALMAQPFDAQRLEMIGEPVLVAEDVAAGAGSGSSDFSVSETGVLTYQRAAIANAQLVWFDRSGQRLGPIGPPMESSANPSPELSPDGKRIAVKRGVSGSEDIWLLELAGGTMSRFTFDPARDTTPIWSPDGNQIVFRSTRGGGRYKLYQKNSSGAGNEELLFEASGLSSLNPQDWSPDGRFLVYVAPGGEKTGFDLSVLPVSGERKPFLYLQTEFNEIQAQFSPDGRWMAYTSNESGRDEVYIQSFPTPGTKRQVSTSGGVQPRWRRDGKELLYLAPDRKLMAVTLRGDATLEIGAPTALLPTQLPYSGATGANTSFKQEYDVTADGQRFVLDLPTEESGPPPITVVLNWPAALKQ